MKTENLQFVVRPVQDRRELHEAVSARHNAYARHLPQFASTLRHPEAVDHDKGVIVLFAESKSDGEVLGTMRIHTSEICPLPLEQSVVLPSAFKVARRAEATRLAVVNGKSALIVKLALFKTFYNLCRARAIEVIVVAGRTPVDRMYDRLLFDDVFPGEGLVALIHAGNIPHRIMYLPVETAHIRWSEAKHPLNDFFVHTHHPDLQFSSPEVPFITSEQNEQFSQFPWCTSDRDGKSGEIQQAH